MGSDLKLIARGERSLLEDLSLEREVQDEDHTPLLTKRTIFQLIAKNLGVDDKVIKNRYDRIARDNPLHAHEDGNGMLGDIQLIDFLNSPIKDGPHLGKTPKLPTSDLLLSIEETLNKISAVNSLAFGSTDNHNMLLHTKIKEALYAIRNGRNDEALMILVRLLELTDTC